MSRGPNVFGLSRDLWDHPLFADEPFTEREAWAWMISAAAWKDIDTRGNAGLVKLKRAEFSFAVRFMAEKWKWSKSRVDRFIGTLEKRDMLRDTSRDGAKIYSIINYNRFQIVGTPKRDSERDNIRDDDGTAAGQQRDKEETGETVKQVIEQQEPPAIAVASLPVLVSRETQKPAKKYPAWLDMDAWRGFVEMRRKKRAPITDRAEKNILAKLELWRTKGHDPTAILDEATEKCWTTIYEPKDQSSHGQRQRPPSAHDKHNLGAALAIASLGGDDEPGRQGEADCDVDRPFFPLLAS